MNFFKRNIKVFAILSVILVWGAVMLIGQQRLTPGPYGSIFRLSFENTHGNTVLTTNESVGLLVASPGSNVNYTTPTATNLCLAFPQIGIQAPGSNVNFSWDQSIRNVATGTITLVGGAGVTLDANNTNTIATLHTRTFKYVPQRCDSVAQAITVYSMQDSAH